MAVPRLRSHVRYTNPAPESRVARADARRMADKPVRRVFTRLLSVRQTGLRTRPLAAEADTARRDDLGRPGVRRHARQAPADGASTSHPRACFGSADYPRRR